jgi:hypothetical protein
MQSTPINSSVVTIVLALVTALALFVLFRGVLTIYRREGPLLGKGKKYIVKGKYAIRAGIGQILIGLSILLIAFNSYTVFTCSAFAVLLILGTIIHIVGGFGDPDIKEEIKQQQEITNRRDNDPVVLNKRRNSIMIYVIISLVLGAGLAGYGLYMSKEAISEMNQIEIIQFFLIGTSCFSTLFFLAFLNMVLTKRARGDW